MRPLPRKVYQGRLARRISKLALRMRLRQSRHTRHIQHHARMAWCRFRSLHKQRQQRSCEEMVRPDVAGVRDAPCVRPVTGHPSRDGVWVCEVGVGGCAFRAGLAGNACAVDENVDPF